MALIYFSSVQWTSFSQRPHKFVEWFHKRTQQKIMWIEPYPTRLPRFSDMVSIGESNRDLVSDKPDWINIIKPRTLPIEPLPGSKYVNGFLWRTVIRKMERLMDSGSNFFVVGKPSHLAVEALRIFQPGKSLYDAMDNFPEFYSGISRLSMKKRELELTSLVSQMWASSTFLKNRWDKILGREVSLVPNALDPTVLPNINSEHQDREPAIFGYIGTVGSWFDWEWVVRIANDRPKDCVRIIGPIHNIPPSNLPPNIELLPACDHAAALNCMKEFSVGLIPFKINSVTESVDPIKFYEYRALGLPIMSTCFGEMKNRGNEQGVFLCSDNGDIEELVIRALNCKMKDADIREFISVNSWDIRFDSSGFL